MVAVVQAFLGFDGIDKFAEYWSVFRRTSFNLGLSDAFLMARLGL